jgi:hypothetical protein
MFFNHVLNFAWRSGSAWRLSGSSCALNHRFVLNRGRITHAGQIIILQRHLSDLGVQCLHVHSRLGAIASCLFQQLVFRVMIWFG